MPKYKLPHAENNKKKKKKKEKKKKNNLINISMKSFSTSADEEVTTYVTGRLLIFPNYIQIIILCK